MHTRKPGRARAAKAAKQAVIQFHADMGQAHPAINVKYRASLYDPAYEQDRLDAVWDMTVARFWADAGVIAQELGYSGVFSEGRSGGWLVPYYQYREGKLYTGPWTGQGPDKGYPSYPDVEKKHERTRFIKLQERIAQLMQDVPNVFKEMLEL